MLNTREERVGFEGVVMPLGPQRCDLLVPVTQRGWSGLGCCTKPMSFTLLVRSNQGRLFWGM